MVEAIYEIEVQNDSVERDERALWGAAFEDDEVSWPEGDGSAWSAGVAPKGTERVRFVAPAWLRVEGERDETDGFVLNLSTRGMACATWREMTAGERLWTRFRVHFAAEPLSLLCEVLWRRVSGEQAPVYGLRFVSLADEEVDAIDTAVRERAEGRAADWSLPIMPAAVPVSTPRRRTAVLSGALGAVAGMVVGVLVAAMPRVGTSAAPVVFVAPAAAVSTDAPEVAPVSTSLVTPSATVSVPEVPSASEPPPSVAPPEPQGALLPRRDQVEEAAQDAGVLRPLGGPDHLELALPTDGTVDEHVAFWLEDPRRLVVDVMGRKSTFERATYDIDHSLASRLRVGKYGDKVRFVIETSPNVSTDVTTRRQDNSLILELRRR